MEKMTDMKMSKAEKKGMGYASPVESSGPDYPWGLTINLDTAALKKLGMKDLPEAGDECMIHAVGKVTRVSQIANDKKEDRSLEIQVTKMSVMHDEDEEDQVRRGYAKGPKRM